MKKIISLIFGLVFSCFSVVAQENSTTPPPYYTFRLINGEEYNGQILEETDSTVVLKLESDIEIQIPLHQIKRRTQATLSDDGKIYFPNPNATRYLFAPSGYGLKKGEGYYQNIYIFFNSVSYGITDYFTIGGGFEILTLTQGYPVFYITPKLSFPVAEKVNIGTGLLYLRIADELDLGVMYGVGTFGSREKNVSLGMGYGFAEGDLANRPTITLSAMHRIGRKFAFVTENWGIPFDTDNYELLYSLGLRFMTPNITVDFAMVNIPDSDLALGIPFIDVVIPFGNK